MRAPLLLHLTDHNACSLNSATGQGQVA